MGIPQGPQLGPVVFQLSTELGMLRVSLLLILLLRQGSGLRWSDPCTHKGESGMCRFIAECPELNGGPLDSGQICNKNAPQPLVCCINRGIFFPSSAPVAPTVDPNDVIKTLPVKTNDQVNIVGENAVINDTKSTLISDNKNTVISDTQTPVTSDTNTPVITDTNNPVITDNNNPVISDTKNTVISDTKTPVTKNPVISETNTEEPDSFYDISDPFAELQLPACGYRDEWMDGEQPLPEYLINGTQVTDVFEVIGGTDAQLNAWPWVALLGYPSSSGDIKWSCDGSLINEQWVLTAAHCFSTNIPVVVRLGEHDYTDDADGAPHQDFGVEILVVHPNYSPPSGYHDLALIKLDRPVNLTGSFFMTKPPIVPICLPWGDELGASLLDRRVALAGWGANESLGNLIPELQVVHLQIFESELCDFAYSSLGSYARIFPDGITDTNFVCAGHKTGGKDACDGDSGAPLVYNTPYGFILAGVVSKGHGCGLKDYPGLYTPVHKPEYLQWIKQRAFETQ